MMHKYVFKLTQLFCNRTKIIVFSRLMLGLVHILIYSLTYGEFLFLYPRSMFVIPAAKAFRSIGDLSHMFTVVIVII